MPRLTKKRSKKAGLPPGSLVHIGERKTNEVKITIMDYNEAHFQEKEVKTIEECFAFKDQSTVTWINIEGIHQVEILEDILNTDQRPKMEDFGEYIYIVLKMLEYSNGKNEIVTEQISLILGKHFVISFQEGLEGDVFDPVRERIRTSKGRIRKMGADYLAYSLLDTIVDNYFGILENLGERIESIEEELVAHPTPETLHLIHDLKREMIFLRRSVWPLREVLGNLERMESTLVNKTTGIYIRDVYDHTIQVIDTIETFRDMLSGMLDIYLSSISNRLNAVMKVLTIIATIFMPLTFMAGVYGMNFKYMPELEWHWGYFAILGMMAIVTLGMALYFKKKRWL